MLVGLNTYNSNASRNARFGQLSTAAAREMYGGLKRIVSTPSEIGRLHKFDTGYITTKTNPSTIQEVARHVREQDGSAWNDIAKELEDTAEALSGYIEKYVKR